MLISELLFEKNDILPDEVLVQLIGPFIRDYIDVMPNDVKNNLKTFFVHYDIISQLGLGIRAQFDHTVELELLSKQATHKIEDKYDMVGDWEYEKQDHISAVDFIYKHQINLSKPAFKASLKKTFGDNTAISDI
ncbi:MAG: hypothetical protein DDT31_00694 [Syntrophomonadaceae bacterium]|nr:hypothetical protein [Bacillota bacterium]